MSTYTDSQNNGNPNLLNDASGNSTFTLGLGLDWCSGTSSETFNISGGYGVWAAPNTFRCSGDNNTINVIGDNTALWINSLSFYGTDNYIVGENFNNVIYLDSTSTQSGDTLDLSSCKITGIKEIYGTNNGDVITGSGQGVPTQCGSGSDVVYESTHDRMEFNGYKDFYDGGAGYNVFYAGSAIDSYLALEPSGNQGFSER